MGELFLKLLEFIWKLLVGSDRFNPISIYLAESPHEVYFEIPSVDHNDYPRGDARSAVQLRIAFSIKVPSDKVLHAAHLYLYRHRPQALVETWNSGPMASGAVLGANISCAMREWTQRNPPFTECELKAGSSTSVVVAKYAVVDSDLFHKTDNPFHACLVLNLSGQFIRLLLQVPQAGTRAPRISSRHERLRELQASTIVDFCARQLESTPTWQNHLDIQARYRPL